VINTNYEAAHY